MGQRGAAKNGLEMVAELKFCMLFRAKISVRIPAVTLNSAPVTVLVVAQVFYERLFLQFSVTEILLFM